MRQLVFLSSIAPEPIPMKHSAKLHIEDSCTNSMCVRLRMSFVLKGPTRNHANCLILKPRFKVGSRFRHTPARKELWSSFTYLESSNSNQSAIQPSCTGGSSSEGEAFFASAKMLCELDHIKEDYKSLLDLGEKYNEFDRDGKLLYILEMQNVLERWKIFYKRMQLSDDFIAKLCAKLLKLEVDDQEGSSNVDMVHEFYDALGEMRKSIEANE